MINQTSLIQVSAKFAKLREKVNQFAQFPSIFKQIYLLRSALGMTQKQLAARIKCQQGDIAKLESEHKADVQISTLKKAAAALNCDLILMMVPKSNIAEYIEAKSEQMARKLIAASSANMAMEIQKPNKNVIGAQIKDLKEDIIKHRRSLLWND